MCVRRARIAVASMLLLAMACHDGSAFDPGVSADPRASDPAIPRVWAQERASTAEGLGADVRGALAYDQSRDCFLLDLEGIQYPVVWPAGTVGTTPGPGVVLSNGTTVLVGDLVSGGGGYLQVADAYGIPLGCRPSTGEVAVFNPNESLRVRSG